MENPTAAQLEYLSLCRQAARSHYQPSLLVRLARQAEVRVTLAAKRETLRTLAARRQDPRRR